MDYVGKLYGKIGDKYFPTGKTSEDWDNLVATIEDLESQLKSLKLNSECNSCTRFRSLDDLGLGYCTLNGQHISTPESHSCSEYDSKK